MSRSSVQGQSIPNAECVFVCGASGTIGGAVLRQLNEMYPNVSVKAQCRDEGKVKMIQSNHPKAEIVKLDFNHIDPSYLRGCNSLFVLSPYSVDMLVQVRQLIDAAKESGVVHVVHLGVCQPEPSYQTRVNYIHWHRLCETYAESSGLSWTHLRPNMFYSNLVNYSGLIPLQGNEIRFPLQPQIKLGWVSEDDIGRVAAKCLVEISPHSSHIYPITSAICDLTEMVNAIRTVPKFKSLNLQTPSIDEVYHQLVSNGSDPVYMTGFKNTILEFNQMQDCSNIPGTKEGLEVVKKIGGKDPISPIEWAQKQSWEH